MAMSHDGNSKQWHYQAAALPSSGTTKQQHYQAAARPSSSASGKTVPAAKHKNEEQY